MSALALVSLLAGAVIGLAVAYPYYPRDNGLSHSAHHVSRQNLHPLQRIHNNAFDPLSPASVHAVSHPSPSFYASGFGRAPVHAAPVCEGWYDLSHTAEETSYVSWSYAPNPSTTGLTFGIECKGVGCSIRSGFVRPLNSDNDPILDISKSAPAGIAGPSTGDGKLFCPPGHFMTSMSCKGAGCTGLELVCAPLADGFRPKYGARWGGNWGPDGSRVYCSPGEYVDGIQCIGSCTKSFNVYCSKVEAKCPVQGRDLPVDFQYSADDRADLYINGELSSSLHNWRKMKTYDARLTTGDVIAIEAQHVGHALYGIIVEMESAAGTVVTGGGKWRAILSSAYHGPKNAWRTSSYDACGWAVPELSKRSAYMKSRQRPWKKSEAEYVWAERAGSRTMIYLRRVFDTECPEKNTPGVSTVSYVGDDFVNFYVNGVFRGALLHWKDSHTDYLFLKAGDVLAFEVRDKGVGFFGLSAAYKLPGMDWVGTGTSSGEWRAIQSKDYTGGDEWRTNGSDLCEWDEPKNLRLTAAQNNAHPHVDHAKYIWAYHGKNKDKILVRTVVGMTCP